MILDDLIHGETEGRTVCSIPGVCLFQRGSRVYVSLERNDKIIMYTQKDHSFTYYNTVLFHSKKYNLDFQVILQIILRMKYNCKSSFFLFYDYSSHDKGRQFLPTFNHLVSTSCPFSTALLPAIRIKQFTIFTLPRKLLVTNSHVIRLGSFLSMSMLHQQQVLGHSQDTHWSSHKDRDLDPLVHLRNLLGVRNVP